MKRAMVVGITFASIIASCYACSLVVAESFVPRNCKLHESANPK